MKYIYLLLICCIYCCQVDSKKLPECDTVIKVGECEKGWFGSNENKNCPILCKSGRAGEMRKGYSIEGATIIWLGKRYAIPGVPNIDCYINREKE